jgi:hypothetical protein
MFLCIMGPSPRLLDMVSEINELGRGCPGPGPDLTILVVPSADLERPGGQKPRYRYISAHPALSDYCLTVNAVLKSAVVTA